MAFRDLLEHHPKMALQVLEKLARIVRTCDDRIMDLATLSAYQRVYAEVLKLTKPDPVRTGSWLVYPLPTQAQIAAQASTTRETVARVLSQLALDGVAERKSKTLYVRDREKLKSLCERPPHVHKDEI
jgi:CRP-like cAMP-binding protein